MGDEDRIRQSAASIIGADERQVASKGRPIPPAPPLGLAAKLFLGIVALFWVVYSAERFAAGRIGQGFASIVVGVLAVLLRWGILDGINRRRWDNPQYRRLHTPEDDRRAAK